MLHGIVTAFLRPSGPYLYLRVVTATYALSAIGRLIPVKRKQVPGYRRHVPAPVWYGGTLIIALALAGTVYLLSPS